MVKSSFVTVRVVPAMIACLGFLGLSVGQSAAQETALRLLVSNGMKGAMEELRSGCERAIGHPLTIQFGSTAALKKRIQDGEAFDLTIITDQAVDDLLKQGRLASSTPVARSELGIGIRAGAAKSDIHTPAALKRVLADAKSITYPQDGASRGDIEKMFQRMGIAAEVAPKIILAPGSGPATESVAAGKATLVITLFSEIVPIPGVEILGPLPGEFHSDVRFSAAISRSSQNLQASKALIAFLTGPKAASVFKAKGLESR
ncbi:MAG TPA: substrate-binding domain-containing protein [Bryobacteraceae bacterium]|jgi:molybdate transport system substrate-binding protein